MAEQLNEVFIEIEVDEPTVSDPALGSKLEEVCPVGIYRGTDSGVEVVAANVDECVLCKLCLEAAPAGTVHVKKLYDGTELA
ncbi:MAG: ferredoxin family protein [Solirubrobacterales bacterium]